jgi:two-component system NarL family response regulator
MTNNLILASSNPDRLNSWKEGLGDYSTTSLIIDRSIIDRLDKLRDEVVRIKPEVLLLDYDLLGLNASNGSASLRRLCSVTKTIIMTDDISENVEWDLVKAGVRGCCQNDIPQKFLKQAVMAVQQGELWIRRSLACRLIDELGKTTSKNKAYRATLGLLNKLTQREYDIAVRVGNGENNKQIAQACGITERTVKAHLTEIYQKLEITDRVNLALVLSSDYGDGLIDLDISLNSRLEQPPP